MLKKTVHVTIILFLCLMTIQVMGQDKQRYSEYEVKAAFIYYFTQFVDWNQTRELSASDTLYIGILGENRFNGDLEKIIAEKVVGGRPLALVYADRIDDLKFCHILYIPPQTERELKRILARLDGQSILTVGDQDNFAELGGVIGFILMNNKIKFKINQEAAERANLRLSSKLLKLAILIDEE
jgi:hypothetical protein